MLNIIKGAGFGIDNKTIYVFLIYLSPLVPLSFKGEGEDLEWRECIPPNLPLAYLRFLLPL